MQSPLNQPKRMTVSENQKRAYQLRQKDTGWGRVAAHLIPLYQVYYITTRKTFTPLLYAIGLQVVTVLIIILFSPDPTVSFANLLAPERTAEWYATKVLQLAISPFLFIGYGNTNVACVFAGFIGIKLGIDQSRQYAHDVLKIWETGLATLFDGRRRAYQLRQEDTGWGRACAHCIPFYPIYYAWTRRNCGTLFFGACSGAVTDLVVNVLYTGKGFSSENMQDILNYINNSSTSITVGEIIGYFVQIVVTKIIINRSRQYAYRILNKTEDQK